VFDRADRDASGDVDLDELLASAEWRALYSADRIHDMFEAMDRDASGSVPVGELFRVVFPLADRAAIRSMCFWTRRRHAGKELARRKLVLTLEQREDALAVFRAIDRDGDGAVTVSELQNMMDVNELGMEGEGAERAGPARAGAGSGHDAHGGGSASGGAAKAARRAPASAHWSIADVLRVVAQYGDGDDVLTRDEFLELMTDVIGAAKK
jgi:Ca2+-binding EF-hand superfamily protein